MAPSGTIALMGSGELTSSMVEVHKSLIAALSLQGKNSFIDTPAGFQTNADQISAGAVDYFNNRVQQRMQVVSYKSRETTSELEAAKALKQIGESAYILMGPGSPTYTIEQLQHTALITLLAERIRSGACLTAASAAALTMGRYTLPVYEIYKVGQPLHWVNGLDLLAEFDLNLVVVPHWNNSEGGTHDTSCCFIGKNRLSELLGKMEKQTPILGVDEHTACILNLAKDTFSVRGVGCVTLLFGDHYQYFQPGQEYPLVILREADAISGRSRPFSADDQPPSKKDNGSGDESVEFWETLHGLNGRCQSALEAHDDAAAVNALLDLDKLLWEGRVSLQNPDLLAEARALFRELIVLVGTRPRLTKDELQRAVTPMVERLLAERQRFRQEANWQAADTLRSALTKAGITVTDQEDKTLWSLHEQQEQVDDQTP